MASLFGRIIRIYLVAFAAFAVVFTSSAQAAPFAAIVIDARSGEVLYEKNADARLHPASLTKMMTLYIAFQEIEAGRLSLDTRVTVTKYAASQPPSRLGLKPGQKIALRYLIRAAAVKSANDAASAIGDHIGGNAEAFAKRMTRTAKQLGMTNTTFKNANGLTAKGHLSSARDMNTLGRHLFYDFPQYYNIFSRRTADAGVATVRNTNSRFLDGYEGADGIKTGYTNPAGFNLTASAQRGGKRIIATVFGGTSTAQRNAKMAELMDLGFKSAKNRVTEQPPVAPEAPADLLLSSAEPQIDVPDAEGGAAKTVRVSGEVRVSPRPKPRPDVPVVPDAVAIALAESIEGALVEANAEPAPEGTLDFQAEAIALAPEAVAEGPADSAVETAAVSDEATEAAVALALAATAEPGTLDAQAAQLANAADPVLLAEATTPETAPVDDALAAVKPKPRPDRPADTLVAEAAEGVAEEIIVAEAEPELVVTDPGTLLTEEGTLLTEEGIIAAADMQPEMPQLIKDGLPEVTDVETVAAANAAPLDAAPVAALAVATITTRKAPIFDSAEPAEVEVAAAEQEVVVVKSTSGGRHFGVNVGDFTSRYEAERALLKTALAESATLNEGLRKISQKDGAWHANFMGLTEEQANLACRRLKARAIPCETLGEG
ncbi:MAG: D-alanyl-D-alanine carboxypeptidase family protein [Tabrizicola sp.]|uniref:D-alanyl-D-alanine carboxypeptidase family protein n=1 Tax=Tabrizicola sp. TaxID=2005166 RepID=UPI002733E766|nr:D-alanyl-D-alanine carboxypeptidase family protein [Tabrizicola sp.]MDP3262353.1 D-alanyl-D-alanine carboxypeptidase family protein [Tabrizicola sp.]MDP3647900.1 D-alanyl-D-alanine carboxypeptidase family protein [Paracoccaceae bacterium]MDZ4069912.1 D-alanyl-D-alanine carboxypeptidase family protein [Tabrizicola sp.]